jgi:hypothetical protein
MPNPTTPSSEALQLAARLAQPKPMRRGSLSERYVKCSKPGCLCATDPNARHGPYFSLTRAVKGRTQSRLVGSDKATMVQRQIAAGHEFRDQVEDYFKICEEWADEELAGSSTQTAAAVKKGGPKRASKAKSARRSSA